MKYNSTNKPLECMMTQSTCYTNTKEFAPKGILWHSTGANNPWLKRYVQPSDNAKNRDEMLKLIGKNQYGNDWNHTEVQAGLNAWIGKLADGTVATVQTMPWNYRPWGCGTGSKGSCNDSHIQFEICEDGLADTSYFNKVYKEACELTAYLCKLYNIDPKGTVVVGGVTVPTIMCHADSYKLGLGSNHGDVLHWFKKHGKTMDNVRNDVYALMNGTSNASKFKKGDVVKVVGTTYYTGKQIPAFVLNNTWVVHSASGNRVVINESVDGKYTIMSAVNASSLKLVSEDTTKPSETVSKQNIVDGAVVSIAKGAKYYSGTPVPNWVINKQWIVRGNPSGDRVVIDKSVDGLNSICSPISSKYLTVVAASSIPVIEKGSKVKVKTGARTYTGGGLASFVYKTTYTVLYEPSGDRVVIGLNGVVTAAMNKKDLIIVK